MILLVGTILFMLGAVSASFIGVVVARLNTNQGFLSGRSRCDACNAVLPPLSLVPIVSYAVSGRHARCCGVRLSLYAPCSELALGGLFVLGYLKLGLTGALPLMLFSLSVLLALVLYDLMHQILPPPLLTLFVVASAATSLVFAPSLAVFLNTFFMAFLLAAFLALIHFLSRGRMMGFADAPLVFGLVLLFGAPSALSGLVFSFWVGAVVGIFILLERPRGSRMGVEVPFAPFLAAGFILAYFTQWNPFIFAALSP